MAPKNDVDQINIDLLEGSSRGQRYKRSENTIEDTTIAVRHIFIHFDLRPLVNGFIYLFRLSGEQERDDEKRRTISKAFIPLIISETNISDACCLLKDNDSAIMTQE